MPARSEPERPAASGTRPDAPRLPAAAPAAALTNLLSHCLRPLRRGMIMMPARMICGRPDSCRLPHGAPGTPLRGHRRRGLPSWPVRGPEA
jgi:hypothetical protein